MMSLIQNTSATYSHLINVYAISICSHQKKLEIGDALRRCRVGGRGGGEPRQPMAAG